MLEKSKKIIFYYIVPIIFLLVSYCILIERNLVKSDLKILLCGFLLWGAEFFFLEKIPQYMAKRSDQGEWKHRGITLLILTCVFFIFLMVIYYFSDQLNWEIGFSLVLGEFTHNVVKRTYPEDLINPNDCSQK